VFAEKFSAEEAPTRPLAPLRHSHPVPAHRPPTRLMLVVSPELPRRGLAWIARHSTVEFDARALQRILRFERLSLG